MRFQKGFTMLEIIIVLIIVGILVALSLPNYLDSMEKSNAQNAENTLLAIAAAQERYYEDNNSIYCVGTCGAAANISSSLNLTLSASDPFNGSYTCSTTSSSYSCTANDTKDSLTMTISSSSGQPSIACSGVSCPSNS